MGEYVLVHVGFAISRVDEAEAERTFEVLRELDQLNELDSPMVEEGDPTVSRLITRSGGDEVS